MTISIRRTSRAADSPGRYFDLGTRWTLITASGDAWQSSPPRQTSRAADSPGSRSATRTADYRRLAIILAWPALALLGTRWTLIAASVDA